MALSKDKIEKLKTMAERGESGERDNARKILQDNGIDWQGKTTSKSFNCDASGFEFVFKTGSSSMDDDPFFNKALRVEGVTTMLEALVVQAIAARVMRRPVGTWHSFSSSYHLKGVSPREVLKITLMYKMSKDTVVKKAKEAIVAAVNNL